MSRRPNILWITTDHHRLDALRCYGSPWAHSPNIDALADQGVRFAQCTCQSPSCIPSRSAVWTGKYVGALGPAGYGRGDVPSREAPLVRSFRRAGYQTVQLGKYDYLNARSALEAQFGICEPGPGPGAALGPFGKGIPVGVDPDDWGFLRVPGNGLVVGGRNPLPPEQTICEIMASRAEKFLAERAPKPFFCRLSINVPHMPFVPLPRFCGITDRNGRYATSAASTTSSGCRPRRFVIAGNASTTCAPNWTRPSAVCWTPCVVTTCGTTRSWYSTAITGPRWASTDSGQSAASTSRSCRSR